MSSSANRLEQVSGDTQLRRIALFGGGRWARILLQELTRISSDDTQVIWISNHLFAESQAWLLEQGLPNVYLQANWDSTSESFDAAIVATNVFQHFDLSRQLLEMGIPTLCEKPVASSIAELELLAAISSQSSVPFGVHLEFLFFTPIQKMSQLLSTRTLEEIEVQWQDPWMEERNGEPKIAEMATDVINDQFPHAWSVICGLTSLDAALEITGCMTMNSAVHVEGLAGSVRIRAILGRRSTERVRRVIVNRGEAAIDFSCSPCQVKIGSEIIDTEHWQHHTLQSSLSSFLNAAQQGMREDRQSNARMWPLSIQSHRAMLAQCIETADQLNLERQQEIDRLERLQRIDLNDCEQVALILDCYLPRLAKSGIRVLPRSADDQAQVAKQIMTDRHNYPPVVP